MKNTELYGTSNTELVTISRAEYEELQAQSQRVSALEKHVDILLEALRLARHKQFGASSEKSDEMLTEQISFLFNEVEVFDQPKKEEVTAVAAHTRHKKHEYTLDNVPEGMPIEVVEQVVKRLKIEPIRLVVEEHRYHTYACRTCDQEDIATPVVKAPREKNIIPGSFATPEAIAHIMTQKFVMGSPLYRQEQELHRQGVSLSRQTIEQLHKELLGRAVLHADETTLQVLHEPDKKPQSESYMWLYRTSGDTDKPIVLYEYQPGRGARHPKAFLTGFRGYLHTDGYAGPGLPPHGWLCWIPQSSG